MRNSEKLGLAMSGLVTAIAKIFKPVVWFLTKSTNFLLRVLRINPNAEDDHRMESAIVYRSKDAEVTDANGLENK